MSSFILRNLIAIPLLVSVAFASSLLGQVKLSNTTPPDYNRAIITALASPFAKQVSIPSELQSTTRGGAQPSRKALSLGGKASGAIVLMDGENAETCGSGGCAFSVFIQLNGDYVLRLQGVGDTVQELPSQTHHYRDIVVRSGRTTVFLYRFNVLRYELAACYDFDDSRRYLEPKDCAVPTYPQAAAPMAALERSPQDPKAIAGMGTFAFENKQYLSAASYYEQALQIDSENLSVRTDLGLCYYRMGDADGAITEYNRVLKSNRNEAMTLYNLGLVKLTLKKDPRGAISVWEHLLATNPDYQGRTVVQEMIVEAKRRLSGKPRGNR